MEWMNLTSVILFLSQISTPSSAWFRKRRAASWANRRRSSARRRAAIPSRRSDGARTDIRSRSRPNPEGQSALSLGSLSHALTRRSQKSTPARETLDQPRGNPRCRLITATIPFNRSLTLMAMRRAAAVEETRAPTQSRGNRFHGQRSENKNRSRKSRQKAHGKANAPQRKHSIQI